MRTPSSESPRETGAEIRGAAEAPLESWKEIAVYLQRNVTTVRRWERSEDLPVHRHQHRERSSVYAYPSELDAWRAARQPGAGSKPAPLWRRPLPSFALAGLVVLSVISVGNGPYGGSAMAAGITTRQVWSGYAHAPSYDGRFLAFTDWTTHDVCIRDLRSGENRKLTNHDRESGQPIFFHPSRDGTQVAYGYWDYKTGQTDLRVIGLDGSEPRIIIPPGEYRFPFMVTDWSPDGRHLLVHGNTKDQGGRLLLVAVADGTIHVLRASETGSPGSGMKFSPDGRYIAYNAGPELWGTERDIYAFAADGGGETPLVVHPSDDYVLGWAPDGSGLLFASNRTGSLAAWFLPVSEGRSQGDPRLVKVLPERFSPLGITQDGAYYFSVGVPTRQTYFATLDPATGELISPPAKAPLGLVGDISQTNWSPDGRQMAYIYRRHRYPGVRHSGTLCVHDFERGQERQFELNLGVSPRFTLRWSPDGQSLLLVAFMESPGSSQRQSRVYQLDPQTGARSSFVGYSRDECGPGRSVDWADWAADGESVYYVCYSRPGGWLIHRDLRTGQDRTVSRFSGGSLAALSPDRQQLAYCQGYDGKVIKLMPVDGGEPRDVHRFESEIRGIAWMLDGQHLVVTTREGGLWWVPLEANEARKLDVALKGLRDLHVHPNGRQIAFTAGPDLTEVFQVWVMENFLREVRGSD